MLFLKNRFFSYAFFIRFCKKDVPVCALKVAV